MARDKVKDQEREEVRVLGVNAAYIANCSCPTWVRRAGLFDFWNETRTNEMRRLGLLTEEANG